MRRIYAVTVCLRGGVRNLDVPAGCAEEAETEALDRLLVSKGDCTAITVTPTLRWEDH
jgi:hypothetical protein